MHLSYSGRKTYKNCPQSYWYNYVEKPLKHEKENKINALYGSWIGTAFEIFYAEKLWQYPDGEQRLVSALPKIFNTRLKGKERYDFKDPSRSSRAPTFKDIYAEVCISVPRGIRSIKEYGFIGHNDQAEMKLDCNIGGHNVGGRADFVVNQMAAPNHLIIIDGKGTKPSRRKLSIDPIQLKWYAMLYHKKTGEYPDSLAFLFWKDEPDTSVQWVDFTPEELVALEAEILENIGKIEAGVKALSTLSVPEKKIALPQYFPTNPEKDNCRWCRYGHLCGKAWSTSDLAPDGSSFSPNQDCCL